MQIEIRRTKLDLELGTLGSLVYSRKFQFKLDFLDFELILGSGYVPEKDYPTVSYRFLSTV